MRGWAESTSALGFSAAGVFWNDGQVGAGRVWWSIASVSTDDPSMSEAYYYGDAPTRTFVAHAVGYTRVSDITNAASLSFTLDSIGPVADEDIVVFHHPDSRSFLALQPLLITSGSSSCWMIALGDFAVYLQTDGSGDFSVFRDVEL